MNAETKPVSPGISDTISGLLSGQLTDVRGSLKQLSDAMSAAREQAIAAAKSKHGVDIDENAWAFPNWEAGIDYDDDKYRA